MDLFFGKIGRGWRSLWRVFQMTLRRLGIRDDLHQLFFEKVQFLSGNFRTEWFFLLLERQKCRSVIEFLSNFSKMQICDQWSKICQKIIFFTKMIQRKNQHVHLLRVSQNFFNSITSRHWIFRKNSDWKYEKKNFVQRVGGIFHFCEKLGF